jgi:beta-lactam-binding protein with PASTA domain
VAVPNIKGYTVAEADSVLAEKGLRYVISDSVYYKEVKRGTIIEQDPLPNQQVKDNRTIYLVVNAMSVPIVPIPELIDLSLRQALATLNTYGFVAGDLEYVPDLARDAVIAQKINGKEVKAGDLVKKGTIINLVMGGGLSDEQVHVPLLIGLNREQALKVLRSGSLNRGAEFFDKTVITSNDTMEATIWKQIPKYGKAMISLGTYVDIWLSRDKDKIELDSNAVHMVDSLGTE